MGLEQDEMQDKLTQSCKPLYNLALTLHVEATTWLQKRLPYTMVTIRRIPVRNVDMRLNAAQESQIPVMLAGKKPLECERPARKRG